MHRPPVIPAPASFWTKAASRTYRGSSSRPPDWVAPLAMSEPLWSDEVGRILYSAAVRRGRKPIAPTRPSKSSGRDDFRLLLMDLAFPAEPFAGAKLAVVERVVISMPLVVTWILLPKVS